MITRCPDCKPHPFQDKRYGPKIRLHTESADGRKRRCTVCGKETVK